MNLRSFIHFGYTEINELADYELISFFFIALLVVVVYFKKRFSKKAYSKQNYSINRGKFDVINHDVLMQEKQVKDDTLIPFTNFSLDGFHVVMTFVLFIIYCYLIL